MLRDFAYSPNQELITTALKQFDLEVPDKYTLLHFELLSPDSFMWRLRIGSAIYYVYAEDFISGMDDIVNAFNKLIGDSQWELVRAKNIKKLHDTSPFKSATVYQEPENVSEMMHYAVDSGHDFVFLARSRESVEDAYFSGASPHRYTLD